MAPAESGRGASDGDVVEFDHWIYGVVPGVGYTTKAVSHGLDAGLYDPYLRGHYTPIRAAAAATAEDEVDLHMIHPLKTGRELLLSRISRGIPDEAGRPTFTNHTVVAPRGVRADSTWAILESALSESVLPRVLDRDEVYQLLTATVRQSADLPLAR